MARGVDMWAAEIVLEIRETNKDIKLMCVSPFKGFEKSWKAEERLKYMNIINQADYVKFIFERYSRMCFQIRNRFMVDNSERVIAERRRRAAVRVCRQLSDVPARQVVCL